jgi:hypothetical protein
MNIKNKAYIQLAIIAIIVLLPTMVQAQPNFSDDVVDAPIDGGLSLLIAGGVGYGVKKLRAAKKSQ